MKIRLKAGTAFNSKRVSEDDIDREEKKKQIALISKRYDQDTKWRNWLAWWVVILCSFWVVCVLLLTICSGLCVLHLSDSVLIALLSSATTSVIGLPLVVLKGLFNHPEGTK